MMFLRDFFFGLTATYHSLHTLIDKPFLHAPNCDDAARNQFESMKANIARAALTP